MTVTINGAVALHHENDGRASKRQKLDANGDGVNRPRRTRSKLFTPFRTIGLVSPTAVPFTSIPLGKTSFQITSSVGRSLQTYDLKRGLNLVFITRPETPASITAITAWRDMVVAAYGSSEDAECGIWLYKRGKLVHELSLPPGFSGDVRQIFSFGKWIVSLTPEKLHVWNSETLQHHTTITSSFPLSGAACHMPTYLNKVFVGRLDGSVDIWNVATGRLIYTIRPRSSVVGAVTAIEPTPALSLLAIAYSSGLLVIQNVKTDVEVFVLVTGTESLPTTSISFRTDGHGAGDDGENPGVMATASIGSGDVSLWDLNLGGRRMGVLYGAHKPISSTASNLDPPDGGISAITFLPGQAILISSGMDNALRSWIFDATPFSPVPRILHSRSGHGAPVTTLQFLPSDFDGAELGGKWLLSASEDRSLWGWSLRRDGQSTELSQRGTRKMAKGIGSSSNGPLSTRDRQRGLEDLRVPRITSMACCLNRDGGIGALAGDRSTWKNGRGPGGRNNLNKTELSSTTGWESVITGHEGDSVARTWFWGRKKAGRWAFSTGDNAAVTAVALSPCGSFALIGSSNGGIDMFNLQSGIHRQRFPPRLTPQQAKRHKSKKLEISLTHASSGNGQLSRGEGKHTDAITGLVVDNTNRNVISCSLDGKIKFWSFSNGAHLFELDWSAITRITALKYHRSSDLLGLSCSDGCIRLIDIGTKKLVRELWGCEGSIADFTFSNDGRWLIATSAPGPSAISRKEIDSNSSEGRSEQPNFRSTIRVWDLPTAHLIDAFRLKSRCVALAFSNTGEHLATSSEGSVGIDIWTNRSLFAHVPTKRLRQDDVADLLEVPTANGAAGTSLVAEAAGIDPTESDEQEDVEIESRPSDITSSELDRLSGDLLTLSLVPKAQWQTLRNLDIVRERNMPVAPPKQPEKAPFFLPNANGAALVEQKPETHGDNMVTLNHNNHHSRILQDSTAGPRTHRDQFTSLLVAAASARSGLAYQAIVTHLSSLHPSAADLAIRTLNSAPPFTEHVVLIEALIARLDAKRDFELVMVWMGVWTKCHGSLLFDTDSDPEHEDDCTDGLQDALQRWKQKAHEEQERLSNLVGFVGGVLGWVRDVN